MSTIRGKRQAAADIRALVAGTTKRFPAKIVLDGAELATANVNARLLDFATAVDDCDKAYAKWRTAVARVRGMQPATRELLRNVRELVRVMFNRSAPIMGEFGMKPRKKPKRRTTKEQIAANAKAKATREARGTLGKRQKAKIKGKPPTRKP
jgi:hypothetical protein